ncbi:D-TA family PLP-dependent enzyme [Rubrolithibacter danxiaensis]|uniref:D-TA family PLP-dependent enzyme n=1 Tax=Rubrolithibacter danxiaensis TaxID=3390805 RepID=UPI003BF89070
MNNSWFEIKNIADFDSPALVVFKDRVKENIRLLITMIDDVSRLRPHVKTHKSKEVAELLIEAGIGKFKCATIAEAEMLALAGAKDVLLAYQPVGPKLTRFISLIKHYPNTKFSCLVDNQISASQISASALAAKLEISVYIDINAGMDRTGIEPGEEAVRVFKFAALEAGIKPEGLHVYDGNIHDPSLKTREEQSNKSFELVQKVRDCIVKEGLPKPVIIAGGTPTFPVHAKRDQVECSPGTFIYWDKGYQDAFQEQAFLPAALIITRVISLPGSNKICLDLGHKSIAAERNLKERVFFLNAADLTVVGQSEEHLVLESQGEHNFQVGDVLYALPYHICPTVALYEKAYIVENHEIITEWKVIARDRAVTI